MILCHNCGNAAHEEYEDGHYYCSNTCYFEKKLHPREVTIYKQAARIKELENALEAILKKNDEPSMFRLPSNCDEILKARRVLQVKE